MEVWTKRTKIITDFIIDKQKVTKLVADIRDLKKYSESPLFSADEDGKKDLEANIKELRVEEEVLRSAIQKGMKMLTSSDTWPSIPLQKEVQEENEKVLGNLKELSSTVEETKASLAELGQLYDGRNRRKVKKRKEKEVKEAPLEPADPNAMEVDDEGPMTTKQPAHDDMVADDEEMPDYGYLRREEELDEIRGKFNGLMEFLDHLKNAIDQQRNEALDTVKEMQADVLAEKEFAVSSLAQKQRDLINAHAKVLKQSIAEIETEVTSANKDVDEVADEATQALQRITALTNERDSLIVQEKQFFEHDLPVYKSVLLEYDEHRKRDEKRYRAIEAALNAYVNRPPSPPQTPDVPVINAPEYVVASLQPLLTDVLRENVKPFLEEVRMKVEEMVKAQNAEMYASTWEKLQLTFSVLEKVHNNVRVLEDDSGGQLHAVANALSGMGGGTGVARPSSS